MDHDDLEYVLELANKLQRDLMALSDDFAFQVSDIRRKVDDNYYDLERRIEDVRREIPQTW